LNKHHDGHGCVNGLDGMLWWIVTRKVVDKGTMRSKHEEVKPEMETDRPKEEKNQR